MPKSAMPLLALAGLMASTSLEAATTVTITSDWASAEVRLVAPKPGAGPTTYDWSDSHQGDGSGNLVVSHTGTLPNSGWYSGTASARFGPTLNVSGLLAPGSSYTQLFASKLLADDNGACEAQATLVSLLKMTISGDSIPFYARGLVEMGHGMDFSLYDFTTGMEVVSRSIKGQSGFNLSGSLESAHEYLLTTHQNALFGEGDGYVQFEFGLNSTATVDYSPERPSLVVPEPTSFSLLASGAVFLLRRRRQG